MLGQLMSKDDKEAAEAEDRIDKFLEVQSKEEADRAQRAQATAGCRTVENRSVINTTEVKEEKRKKEATRLKELGNQAFRRGEHGLAEEYYTSALMQWDKEPVFYTNRAQAHIQQGKYQEAVDDCKEAIKLTGQSEDNHCGCEGPALHERLPESLGH